MVSGLVSDLLKAAKLESFIGSPGNDASKAVQLLLRKASLEHAVLTA